MVALIAVSNLAQGAWSSFAPWANLTGAATLILAAMTLFTRRRTTAPSVVPLIAFLAALVLGYLAPALNSSAPGKRQQILLTVLLPALVVRFAPTRWKLARPFAWTLLALSLGIAALQFVNPAPMDLVAGRRTPNGVNPINTGRLLAAGALASLVLLLSTKKRLSRLALLVIGATLLLCAATTGSRGPLAACLVAGFILIVTTQKLPPIVRLMAWTGVAASSYVLFTRGLESESRLTSSDDGGRLPLIRGTISAIEANPLGIGWGNLYNYLPPGTGVQSQGYEQYPHNLFLEFASEAGVISIPLVLFAIVAGGLNLRRLADDDRALFTVLTIFALLSAMVSTNVVGNRLLWMCLAIGFGAAGVARGAHRGASRETTSRARIK